jgi:hypothetical protein
MRNQSDDVQPLCVDHIDGINEGEIREIKVLLMVPQGTMHKVCSPTTYADNRRNQKSAPVSPNILKRK